MAEFFERLPEESVILEATGANIVSRSPNEVINIAKRASHLIRADKINPATLLVSNLNYLEGLTQSDEQVKTLLFLICLGGKYSLWEGTEAFLSALKEKHGFAGEFSRPFQRFISQRLQILSQPKTTKGFEDIEDTKKMLELLQKNGDFLNDLSELQKFFKRNISPVMPLNATWNPQLTERFRVKNAEGLWYIYSHNLRAEYLELMKKHLSSEWTGFNRFINEPWEVLKGKVNTKGNLVDIGSSIGITALEIAQALEMQGTIILLDYYNPYRNISSLRIIDYANPRRRLIPFNEAFARMEDLRANRVVMQLFGVDIGKPLSDDVQGYIQNASLVHMGNILPYIPRDKLYGSITNGFGATSESGGLLKIFNDENLPTGSLLTALTLQRNGDRVSVLRDTLKGNFQL